MLVTARVCLTVRAAMTGGDGGGPATGRDRVDGERLRRSVLPVERPAATRCLWAGEGDQASALIWPISVCRPSMDIFPRCGHGHG